MLDVRFHVCPKCGNVIVSTGNAEVRCCGNILPALQAEQGQGMRMAPVNGEYVISVGRHPMTKDHYFAFYAAVSDDGVQLVRLFPGGKTEARFRAEGVKRIYMYCTVHGLYYSDK